MWDVRRSLENAAAAAAASQKFTTARTGRIDVVRSSSISSCIAAVPLGRRRAAQRHLAVSVYTCKIQVSGTWVPARVLARSAGRCAAGPGHDVVADLSRSRDPLSPWLAYVAPVGRINSTGAVVSSLLVR